VTPTAAIDLPRAGSWAVLPWLAFAVAMTAALLGPLAADDLVYGRTRFSIWATLLLATPALILVVLRAARRPFGPVWRAWWTVAFAGYLVHLWYGFAVMFGADLGATFEAQGTVVATSNFLLALLWAASVAIAWWGRPMPWLHGAASLLFCVSALTSTLVFGRPPSPWFGGALLGGLVAAAVLRLWRSAKIG
jgi:hypothetical protein